MRRKVNQKDKNNLQELIAKIRAENLYLALHTHKGSPQLIVTTANPLKKSGTEAYSFFILPFLIPSLSDDVIKSPEEVVKLKIEPFSKKITGIADSVMRIIMSPRLEENIKQLKEIKNTAIPA